ncbi:hypothetical protein F8388_004327 [Cannabis sativa]|uniref:Nuclear pore complex protein NUP1 n=1 Tax=Cannabis sativa TaxID=3483 RepID=A0A7J6HBM4_CANSA|nr:hypothetical protein F8388_004327 [Cannabis sativa]
METSVETTSLGEQRGAGGKLKRPARKPPSTPYSRPPALPTQIDRGQRRWLSKLVDPAYRLISDGASIFFPNFFSKLPLTIDATTEDHENQEAETVVQDEANGNEQNDTHELSGTTGVVGPGTAADVSENISDLVLPNKDKGGNLPNESGLSEIEKDEVNHLMLIINSRAAEVPDVHKGKEYQRTPSRGAAASHEIISTSDRNQRDLQGSLWKTSTPLPKSAMPDDVCASPIDIAKAYMGSRTLETGHSIKGMISKEERNSLYSADFVSKPFMSSPSSKPCWPGAMLQDEQDHLTPQSQSGRYGLHNIPRTPYSRTIFSKSKSKLMPSLGDSDKGTRPSTSLQTSQTPVYGQVKSSSDALEDNHGSTGPIRRSRNRFGTQTPGTQNRFGRQTPGTQHRLATQTPGTQHRLATHSPGTQSPFRGSGFIEPSSVGPSRVENSSTSQGFLPAFIRSVEPREISGSQFHSANRKNHSYDVGVPTVHPHSSQIARTILDHIDRNPPTPKDKSQELRLAFEWKKPDSSSTPSIDPNQHKSKNSLLNLTALESQKIVNQDDQNKPAQDTSDKSNSRFMFPHQESTVKSVDTISNPRSNVFLSNGVDGVSQMKNSHEEVTKITSSQVVTLQKKPAASGTNKPLLSNISVDKPNSIWKFSSDQSSGFTFPVSTASGVSSEPPTPSIMPSFSANTQLQLKDGHAIPSYTFGSSSTTPSLVFSFPSTSSSAIQNDTSDIKFSFGSDNPRLSFGSVKKDAICY